MSFNFIGAVQRKKNKLELQEKFFIQNKFKNMNRFLIDGLKTLKV